MSVQDSGPLVIDDPKPCGIGELERCCAFLVVGGRGFECGRTIPGLPEQVRARIAAGSYVSRYDPGDVPYPTCRETRPT